MRAGAALSRKSDKGKAMSITLIGVFDKVREAQQARSKLAEIGIDKASMRVSGADDEADGADGDDKPGAIGRYFTQLFGSHPDAETYTEAVERGHLVLTATQVDERRRHAASAILENCGAIDLDERLERWRSESFLAQRSFLPAQGHDWPRLNL